MNRETSLMVLTLAASGLATGVSYAQEATERDDSRPVVPDEYKSEQVYDEIELGIGYVSEDAYKFGRYNGMQTGGNFLELDIDSETYYEDGRFTRIRGTDLGLESRYLYMESGLQGSYSFFLEYDELPNYKDNTVLTPFNYSGTETLRLPAGFDLDTNLEQNLKSFEVGTKRERIGTGMNILPKERWQFRIDLSNEAKKGIDITGAAIADGPSRLVGRTSVSLLPEPIDYDTSKFNASMYYSGDEAQLDLRYHVSLFDNNNEFLTWDNPFDPAASSQGSMSLEPDNEFHQLSLTGSYSLPYRSHFTGMLSLGRMTQSEDFLPYTVNPDISALTVTRANLDGEVWLGSARLKLSSRPTTKLRLSAELSYDERDNQTRSDSYSYVVLDSFSGQSTSNQPYSYWNNRFKLDANYRFNSITSLSGGYKFDDMKREHDDLEREKTEEDTAFLKWKIKPVNTLHIALYAESSNRAGSEYNEVDNQISTMRRYNLADRDRTLTGARVDYTATDRLAFGLQADYSLDEYNSTEAGLLEAEQPSYTVDVSYQPRPNISTYGYYSYEQIQSSQAGLELAPTSTTAGWEADFDDRFDTSGIGATLTGLGKWDIGTDIVYSKSKGTIEMFDLLNPGTEDQYPDLNTELTSINLWTNYRYSKQLVYKFGYRYEDYKEDNWAVDDLPVYDPLLVSNTLLLGNDTLDYRAYVITASVGFRY